MFDLQHISKKIKRYDIIIIIIQIIHLVNKKRLVNPYCKRFIGLK